MKKLYIGNLAYSTTEDGLRSAFAKYTSVISVKIVTDKFSGASRGFGFVELDDDAEAGAAINELEGYKLDGKALTVNEARPMQRTNSGGGRSWDRGGGSSGKRTGSSRRSY